MKIGINGRFLDTPFTGIGKYTLNLLLEMLKLYPEDIFFVVMHKKISSKLSQLFKPYPNVHFEIVPEKPLLKKIHAGLAKLYWEKVQIKNFFQKAKVELIHIPYPSAFYIKNKPYLVTVHDTIPWVLPEYKKKKLLSLWYHKVALRSILRASHLFTVSNFSKQEILNLLPSFSGNQITITSNACTNFYQKRFSKEQSRDILKKYGITSKKPFIFYIGGFDLRKNVERLINIYTKFVAPHLAVDLILGGGKIINDKFYQSYDVTTEIKHYEHASLGDIIKTGFIEEEDLPAFYQRALAYINLSKYEGFNLPLLEALLSHTPTIVSGIPIHREVAQKSPFYIDLTESDEKIGKKILNLLSDSQNLSELKVKTLQYKNNYSWIESAKIAHGIYKKYVL